MDLLNGLNYDKQDEDFLDEEMENTIQKLYSLEKDIDEILERNSIDNPSWISLEQYSAEGIGDVIKEKIKNFSNSVVDVLDKISDRSSNFADLFRSNDKILNNIISQMKSGKFNEAKFKELKANILTIRDINYLAQGISDLNKGSFEEIPDYRAIVNKAINTVKKYGNSDKKLINDLLYSIDIEFEKWCDRLPKFNMNTHGIEVIKDKKKSIFEDRCAIKSAIPTIIKNKKEIKLIDAKLNTGNIIYNLGVSLKNVRPLNLDIIFKKEITAEFKYFEKFMKDLTYTSIMKGRVEQDGSIFFTILNLEKAIFTEKIKLFNRMMNNVMAIIKSDIVAGKTALRALEK